MAIGGKLPAPLDLGRAKLFVPSPRMSLRRTPTYNKTEKQSFDRPPLSSTSSRFSFNHLLFTSPPASPSLPALLPRPRKSPTRPRPTRVLRLLLFGASLMLVLYVAALTFHPDMPMSITLPILTEEFEMVGQDELPEFATPIVVTDTSGRSKWTVAIPFDSDFPLSVEGYSDMCSKCREVASRVRDMHNRNPLPQQTTLGHDGPADKYFVDVPDAERSGLLPGISRPLQKLGNIIGDDYFSSVQKPICKSSMTFVLESTDAGLGNTLMELWIFYGLAMKQGRSFFIDDSRWAYGKYTDMFQPPPIPDCRPPPRHQMLPCPAQARHLVVSPGIAKDMWSDSLNQPYPESRELMGKPVRDMFRLASEGYRALFDLNKDDAKFVEDRVKQVKEKVHTGGFARNDGMVVGMHIRRGDRRPLELQYSRAYIPTDAYVTQARSLVEANFIGAGKEGKDDKAAERQSVFLVASDDPTVYSSEELAGAMRAQEQIRLASKEELQTKDKRNPKVMRHFVEESFGWEGGFFAPMFWNLGLPSMSSSNANTAENMKLSPSNEALRLRSYIARAYLMDLAVLAGASDKVVCTVSAMGCRLLAVMMGWEHAMENQGWVNIDGQYGWTALTW